MWYNNIKSKMRRTKGMADMVAGARILPIYAADGSSLYVRIDNKEVYKEGEVNRDEFRGPHQLQTLSISGLDKTKAQSEISYWDANRGSWDQSTLEVVSSWYNIIIVCGDADDDDYVGAFEGCGNFTGMAKNAGAPILDGDHTVDFFKDCTKFSADLKEWDFSNILRSDGMFDGCVSFTDAAFHNTLLKMNMDKNEAITPDNPQYIGAEGVTVTSRKTANLIAEMKKVGQIVTGYISDIPAITFNSEQIFNTTFYTFDGNKTVV
jgi:hypothetical protein